MKIGIDISQLAFERTGVANYLKELLTNPDSGTQHSQRSITRTQGIKTRGSG